VSTHDNIAVLWSTQVRLVPKPSAGCGTVWSSTNGLRTPRTMSVGAVSTNPRNDRQRLFLQTLRERVQAAGYLWQGRSQGGGT